MFGRAKSCILLFLFGAPAHQDIWDLKPEAPAESAASSSRSPAACRALRSANTSRGSPGWRTGFALVRSVQHPDNTHTVAMHYMLTGQPPCAAQHQPAEPADGLSHASARWCSTSRPGEGRLPRRHQPERAGQPGVGQQPHLPRLLRRLPRAARTTRCSSPHDPSARRLPPVPAGRRGRRAGSPSRRGAAGRASTPAAGCSTAAARARLRRDTTSRPSTWSRRRAARGRSTCRARADRARATATAAAPFGQGCLLARRLVEAGVPLVTVNWARDDAFWDTHANNFNLLKNSLLPPFDRGFSALLDDLRPARPARRDAGRLPGRVRPHAEDQRAAPAATTGRRATRWCWPAAASAAGRCYGASDRMAAYPATAPVYARRPGGDDLPRAGHRPPPGTARQPGPAALPHHRPSAGGAVVVGSDRHSSGSSSLIQRLIHQPQTM